MPSHLSERLLHSVAVVQVTHCGCRIRKSPSFYFLSSFCFLISLAFLFFPFDHLGAAPHESGDFSLLFFPFFLCA